MKKIVIIALVVAALAGSVGSALAGGYPFLTMVEGSDDGTSTVVILGKFSQGAGQFTFDEANGLVTNVISAVTSLLGTTGGAGVLTPQQLTSLGYGDADNDKTILKTAYKAAGIEILVFVDIKKTTVEYVAGYGPNMRIDVTIADMGTQLAPLVPAGDLYVASIELPYTYVTLLNSPQ